MVDKVIQGNRRKSFLGIKKEEGFYG